MCWNECALCGERERKTPVQIQMLYTARGFFSSSQFQRIFLNSGREKNGMTKKFVSPCISCAFNSSFFCVICLCAKVCRVNPIAYCDRRRTTLSLSFFIFLQVTTTTTAEKCCFHLLYTCANASKRV